ncbi:MAG: hypothetical protein RL358_1834, partial [Pseudomonadota bacterium]
NIDDLLSPPVEKTPQPASAPVQFDIAKVVIAKTNLAYVDELSGANYAINDLELSTSRIAPNVPVKIALAVGVTANQPKLAIQTNRLKNHADFRFRQTKLSISRFEISCHWRGVGHDQIAAQCQRRGECKFSDARIFG